MVLVMIFSNLRTLVYVLSIFALCQPAVAEVSDEDFAKVQAQLMLLTERMTKLERINLELMATNSSQVNSILIEGLTEKVEVIDKKEQKASWADRISFSGDFRYRSDFMEFEPKGSGSDTSRQRQRIRARPVLKAKLDDNVEVGFGLVTGGDSPTSGNQTLGGGGNSKDIALDLGYVSWQATEAFNVTAGKFKNVFYKPGKTQMLWDGDFRPEGIAVSYQKNGFFGHGIVNWIESDSASDNKKVSVWGLQSGYQTNFDGIGVKFGGGFYNLGVADSVPAYEKTKFNGNTTVGPSSASSPSCDLLDESYSACVYRYDYHEVELFADVTFDLAGMPWEFWVDYVKNTAADDHDDAYEVGLGVGKLKKPGDWSVSFRYKDVSADAVLGGMTDSDFGNGGTDAKGWVLSGGYAFTPRSSFKFTYFDNTMGDDGNRTHEDFQRLMVDWNFKY
jgi:hypothetical protein